MQRQNVQRSIKRLMELGVILEGVKIGVSRSYRLIQASAERLRQRPQEALHEHLKVIK